MLSEDALERLSERLVDRIESLNTFFIKKIGKQIKTIGTVTPSQLSELLQSVQYGNDIDEIMNNYNLNNTQKADLINAFITKDLSKCDWVCTWKTKSVRFESPQPVSWTLDGEYGGEHTEIQFSVKEKAVDFLIGGVPVNN